MEEKIKEMEGKITTLEQTISAQQRKIDVLAGEIALKIDANKISDAAEQTDRTKRMFT